MELIQEIIDQLKVNLRTTKTYHDLMGKNRVDRKIIKKSLKVILDIRSTLNFEYEKYLVIILSFGIINKHKIKETHSNNQTSSKILLLT